MGTIDDNEDVTLVIIAQALLLALAALLLLEVRYQNAAANDRELFTGEDSDDIEFHPELIARWDDEADYAREPVCTRPMRAPAQVRRRPADDNYPSPTSA